MSRRRGTHGYVRGRTRGTSYGTLKGIRRGIGWEQHCGGPATSPVPTSYVEAGRRDPSCRAAGRRGVTAFGVRARRAQACHRGRMDRVDPETASGERTTLEQFLDYQRATLLHKTTGLSHAQMNYQLPTSALSLAGLLKHLALVEDDWIQVRFFGRPEFEPWASAPWDENRDWEFHTAEQDDPDELRSLYSAACHRSQEATAASGLDELSVGASRQGQHWNLRWVLTHLVEETARHNGHADFLREAVDGSVGE